MATIIKRINPPKEETWKVTCWYCTSIIAFDRNDWRHSVRNTTYVICPVCKRGLEWVKVLERGEKYKETK